MSVILYLLLNTIIEFIYMYFYVNDFLWIEKWMFEAGIFTSVPLYTSSKQKSKQSVHSSTKI